MWLIKSISITGIFFSKSCSCSLLFFGSRRVADENVASTILVDTDVKSHYHAVKAMSLRSRSNFGGKFFTYFICHGFHLSGLLWASTVLVKKDCWDCMQFVLKRKPNNTYIHTQLVCFAARGPSIKAGQKTFAVWGWLSGAWGAELLLRASQLWRRGSCALSLVYNIIYQKVNQKWFQGGWKPWQYKHFLLDHRTDILQSMSRG